MKFFIVDGLSALHDTYAKLLINLFFLIALITRLSKKMFKIYTTVYTLDCIYLRTPARPGFKTEHKSLVILNSFKTYINI